MFITITKKGKLKKSIRQLQKNTATELFLEDVKAITRAGAEEGNVDIALLEKRVEPFVLNCVKNMHNVIDSAHDVHRSVSKLKTAEEKLGEKVQNEVLIEGVLDRITGSVKSTFSRINPWGKKEVHENQSSANLAPANA